MKPDWQHKALPTLQLLFAFPISSSKQVQNTLCTIKALEFNNYNSKWMDVKE